HEPTPIETCVDSQLSKLKNEFLISGIKGKSWVIYRFIINGTDLTLQTDECVLDNIFTFYKGGGYIQIEGPSECIDRESEAECGTWEISEDGTKFLLNGSKFDEDLDIVYLNESDMHVKFISPVL